MSDKMKQTSTERSRKFRNKVKSNPEKLLEARKKDRERKKKERAACRTNVDQLEEMREKKRDQMRRYRNKKKEGNVDSLDTSNKQKGGKKAIKTVIKRNNKRISRDKEGIEALKKQKAVLSTQNWRLRLKLKDTGDDTTVSTPTTSGEFSSYWSERRAVKRATESIPMTPMKKAKVIEKLTQSPRTSKILEARGVLMTSHNMENLKLGAAMLSRLKADLDQVKPKGGSKKDKLHVYRSIKSVITAAPLSKNSKIRGCLRKYFKVKMGVPMRRTGWWNMKPRNKRKDCLSKETIACVKEHYLSTDVSQQIPGKSEVVKMKDVDGALQTLGKHIMIITLEEAFKTFKAKHPEMKIGLTSFKKLKPRNVKKVSETNRRTCLCTTCCNLALKVQSLKQFITAKLPNQKSLSDKLSKTTLQDAVLCQYEHLPSAVCLERSCEKCPNIRIYLQDLKDLDDEIITWCHWEYIRMEKEDGTKRFISCLEKKTPLQDFISCLDKDLLVYPYHIFRAKWQHTQMSKCITDLDNSGTDVILLMDFSENYRCSFKDEVQSGYFDQQQVTVHPMMAYYRENYHLVKHAIIGISPDSKHDAALVKAFENDAIKVLKAQPTLSNLSQVVEWTDGCASQYKCKFSFADISKQKFACHRNYFETSHRKSPCDGLGSVVKNSCYRAVITGKTIIGDAKSVYQHCMDNLAHGSKEKSNGEISRWDFVYVDRLSRPDEPEKLLSIKGTHKIHTVQCISQPYSFKSRLLSCYCNECTHDNTESCTNKKWVQPWVTHSLSSETVGASVKARNPNILYST